MFSIRVASLSLVVALAIVPLPAAAQGPPSGGGGTLNLTELAARITALEANLAAETAARVAANNVEAAARATADTTLQGQIDKLKGNNITASDLEGAYNLYFIATAMDTNPAAGNGNRITSYVITGSLVLGPNGTGHGSAAFASGTSLTERLPGQTWLAAGFKDVPFAGESGLSWEYSNGTVTVIFDSTPDDPTVVTPAGNGQVMVGIQGGPPGNNQAIMFLTRQP